MALQVIGPGFGRTGTNTLKYALEMLDLGPCHHMEEVFPNPQQLAYWQALAAGESVDWDQVFEGYRSQVDWPGAHVWRELAAAYPEAKVILTVRPEEDWWRSFSNTIGKLMAMDPATAPLPPPLIAVMLMADKLFVKPTFGDGVGDKQTAIKAFRQRIADVRAAIPPERLLVFNVAEGWEPLCAFLGKPVPAAPFPVRNTTDDFWKMLEGGH